jgi:hypothetical protein
LVMGEDAILFKLHLAFILDICKVIEHIDMLSIGKRQQPYSIVPTLLGSDFGDLGHFVRQNDVICFIVEAVILFKLHHASMTCKKFIILLLTKRIYQISNLMKIIVKWHDQHKPMI